MVPGGQKILSGSVSKYTAYRHIYPPGNCSTYHFSWFTGINQILYTFGSPTITLVLCPSVQCIWICPIRLSQPRF